ncbi:LacI family DNA-binding transcriptional regulator [Actinomycetota bacterium]
MTIIDVAREAGVAPSTVSRAFTNPTRVGVVTREHVVEVAERLGYRPNPVARALGTGRTMTLALVLPDIGNPYFTEIIRGAERQAQAAGYTLVIADSQESAAREDALTAALVQRVDGILLCSSRMSDKAIASLGRSRPTVLVGRAARTVASVVPDQAAGTEQIVAHLASLGHERLAFLAGPVQSWLGSRRWAGISRAAGAAGLTVTRLGPFPPTVEGGRVGADPALATGATAVVAHNDLMAIGVLKRLAARGVGVPDDISVVGFDNILGSDFCSPALTTLGHSTVDSGRVALDLLARLVERDQVQTRQVVLPTELLIRESTGPRS